MPKPVPEVVALLEDWLAEARCGGIVSVAVVGLDRDGEWMEDWHADELAPLVFAVRSTVIRMQMPAPVGPNESKH